MAQTRRRLAIASSLLLICIHLALFGSNLSNPGISQFDEFLTVDRTLGFLRTGDFLTTYTNCQPCWIKPPLQFYLGALSTKLGLTPVVALRLWSATFAALSLWIFRLTTGVESHDGRGLGFSLSWLNWLLTDSWLFWVLTLALLVWVFCNPTLRQETSFWLLAPVVPVLLGFTFGGGPFGGYYILTFVPLVAVVTAILLGRLIQNEQLLPLIALFVFFASGKNLAQANLRGAEETLFDLRASCYRMSSHLRPGETPLFLAYDDPFSAAFGILEQPLEICTVGKFPEAGQDYLAVVRLRRLGEVQQRWPGRSEVLETVGRFATVRLDSNRLSRGPGERL